MRARSLPCRPWTTTIAGSASNLISDRRSEGHDTLEALLEAFEDVTDASSTVDPLEGLDTPECLVQRIISGNVVSLEEDLSLGLENMRAIDIINDQLLAGMKTVGELFGSGKMQLPFVLRSAQTMKTAVRFLEPHLDKVDPQQRGSIVLATVSGDVRDIGKNLVDIILTNNGYTVHNLGIKVPIAQIIGAFEEHDADAIGMSGLLVKSTLVMRDNLDEIVRQGLEATPVLLGGAALTRTYVEKDLGDRYPGPLVYGKDAFAGLDAMEWITQGGDKPTAPKRFLPEIERDHEPEAAAPPRSPSVAIDEAIPDPPFVGSRVATGIELGDVTKYLNTSALLRNQWQYRPHDGESNDEITERLRPQIRSEITKARSAGLFRQQYQGGRYSWGYPACPDLEDNLTVADLLDAQRIGVVVGPETGYQHHPEQTTSAIICHHPQAKYFIARKPREQRRPQ